MITPTSIIDYLENLATQNINLNSFFTFDIAEIQGAVRSGIQYPCLALENPEGNFDNSQVNNSLQTTKLAFTIFNQPRQGDYSDQNTKLTEAFNIGIQILQRMRHDARIPYHLLYNIFKLNRVSYHKVGYVFSDRLHGYRFEIELDNHKVNMQIDPADWTDLSSPCP